MEPCWNLICWGEENKEEGKKKRKKKKKKKKTFWSREMEPFWNLICRKEQKRMTRQVSLRWGIVTLSLSHSLTLSLSHSLTLSLLTLSYWHSIDWAGAYLQALGAPHFKGCGCFEGGRGEGPNEGDRVEDGHTVRVHLLYNVPHLHQRNEAGSQQGQKLRKRGVPEGQIPQEKKRTVSYLVCYSSVHLLHEVPHLRQRNEARGQEGQELRE